MSTAIRYYRAFCIQSAVDCSWVWTSIYCYFLRYSQEQQLFISSQLASCPNSNNVSKFTAQTININFQTDRLSKLARSGRPSKERRYVYANRLPNYSVTLSMNSDQTKLEDLYGSKSYNGTYLQVGYFTTADRRLFFY